MGVKVTVRGGELKGLRKYLAHLLENPKPGVKVGVLDGAAYSDGPLAGEPVAQNLARHEFGTESIPARAPFRSTLEKKKGEWSKGTADYLKAASGSGKMNIRAALTQMGDAAAMDIQQSFEDGLEPELKEATIRRKEKMGYGTHAAKPVMLTGQSQKAITSEYVDDITKDA